MFYPSSNFILHINTNLGTWITQLIQIEKCCQQLPNEYDSTDNELTFETTTQHAKKNSIQHLQFLCI